MKIDEEELIRRAETVTKTCSGVIPYNEVMYVESILYSSGRSLHAFKTYETHLNPDAEASFLIPVVQEAIGHAAALARYFWPSGGGAYPKEVKSLRLKRAEKLRASYGLNDDSTIHAKSIRDVWEHFDERLDMYLLNNDAGHFFPSPTIGSHKIADEPTSNIFKLLDTDAQCLVLLGRKYFFAPMRDEVQKIYNHSKGIMKSGGRI